MPEPVRNENIERFLATLPDGIRQHVNLMRSLEDGLLYPSVAIRHWIEIQSETADGVPVKGSTSQWTVDAITNSRQYAGILTDALYKHSPAHYEVWALFPFGTAPGPHILDHKPNLQGLWGDPVFHGKKGRYTDITAENVREFAYAYTLDYYQIHPSNRQYVEILAVDHHNDHHANWYADMQFSAKGHQVKLLIHPTTNGLEVFAHKYDHKS